MFTYKYCNKFKNLNNVLSVLALNSDIIFGMHNTSLYFRIQTARSTDEIMYEKMIDGLFSTGYITRIWIVGLHFSRKS